MRIPRLVAASSMSAGIPGPSSAKTTSTRPLPSRLLVHALGCVDLNLLRLNGEAIAFAYNYHSAGRLFGLRVGYDASLARDGAGNLLYALIIEDSFQRGDTWYDMGPGSLEAKQYLWSKTERLLRFSHYPRTAWRAQLVRLKRHLAARPAAAASQG